MDDKHQNQFASGICTLGVMAVCLTL